MGSAATCVIHRGLVVYCLPSNSITGPPQKQPGGVSYNASVPARCPLVLSAVLKSRECKSAHPFRVSRVVDRKKKLSSKIRTLYLTFLIFYYRRNEPEKHASGLVYKACECTATGRKSSLYLVSRLIVIVLGPGFPAISSLSL
jgi:hypothetical protein